MTATERDALLNRPATVRDVLAVFLAFQSSRRVEDLTDYELARLARRLAPTAPEAP